MSELVILTGISGAGKSTCMFVFEELNYYCMENCPLPLIKNLLSLMQVDEKYKKTAISVNAKDAEFVIDLAKTIKELKVTTIFLDCSSSILLSRFKLTRHVHPLQTEGKSLEQAITIEKETIEDLRGKIDLFLDTSGLNVNELRKMLFSSFKKHCGMTISFMSFGFKHGVPSDVDMIFDARILPNPFYIAELKYLTGCDKKVYDFVMKQNQTKEMIPEIIKFLDYYLTTSENDGRSFIVVGIGCSGGQHRSVALVNYLVNHYHTRFDVHGNHRDILRGKTYE